MPTRPSPNETREMRLFSNVIYQHTVYNQLATTGDDSITDNDLPQFLARRRAPGEGWRSWDEIRFQLREVTGEFVTDGTIRKWARRYGIPEGTLADGSGEVTAEVYAEAIREAGINIS